MRASRTVGVITSMLIGVGGYVHLCLYRHGYRTIPKIGVAFLMQIVASVVVAVALLLGPRVVARMIGVAATSAATLLDLAAATLAAGTLVAFALTRTSAGLFGFRERGLEPSPQALIALLAETSALVLAGGWWLARHARHGAVATQVRRV
jgi:hypothetical protein